MVRRDGAAVAPRDRPLRLVYTGKFAPRWNTYEMTPTAPAAAARGIDAQLHMVGEQIHWDPADSGWEGRMRAALGPLQPTCAETATGVSGAAASPVTSRRASPRPATSG